MNILDYALKYQKGNKLKVETQRRNDMEFMNQFNSAIVTALNCFEWHNLPNTVDARMLELSAVMNGVSIIGYDRDKAALFSLIACPDGSLTLYGYPAGAYGYGLNGYNKHFTLYVSGGENVPVLNRPDAIADAVLLKDNLMMYPLVNYLELYSERIADAKRSIDVLARGLKSPSIIKTDPAGVESVKKVLSDITSNMPYIVGINDSPYSSMDAIDTGIKPENLKVLYEYSQDLQSGLYNLLGINSNPESTKRERMLVDEVNANNMETAFNINARLERRREFCKQVNELFKTDISVSINKTLVMQYNDTEKQETEKEGAENDDNNTEA